jgi:transcriptional regulator with XRE-family HTH domain
MRSAPKPAATHAQAREWVAYAFGRVLRRLRKDRGLSQEELAGEAELDRTYPSLLERGLRSPTITIIFALAMPLGVSPAYLADETEEELKKLRRKAQTAQRHANLIPRAA